jgi:hypothetical protein
MTANAVLSLEDLVAISQIVLALIAALALIGAVAQALLTRSDTRQTLTYNYTHRFSDPALIPYRQKTADLLAVKEGEEDARWDVFRRMSLADQLAVLVLPNLVEELAGMYNNNLLNKKIAKDFFGFTAYRLWEEGWWFTQRARRTYADYYAQWEKMLRDMGYRLPDPAAVETKHPRQDSNLRPSA